jgi:hypothetical protein
MLGVAMHLDHIAGIVYFHTAGADEHNIIQTRGVSYLSLQPLTFTHVICIYPGDPSTRRYTNATIQGVSKSCMGLAYEPNSPIPQRIPLYNLPT